MICPHQGKELELMLEGTKPLAAFADIFSDPGVIPEEIIPQNAFQEHVSQGRIIKSEESWPNGSGTYVIICYSLPDKTWRAQSYIWLRKQIHDKKINYTDELDIIFGRLLGYTDEDINHFFISQSGHKSPLDPP